MGAGANPDGYKRKCFSNAVSKLFPILAWFCSLTGGAVADSVEAPKNFLVED